MNAIMPNKLRQPKTPQKQNSKINFVNSVEQAQATQVQIETELFNHQYKSTNDDNLSCLKICMLPNQKKSTYYIRVNNYGPRFKKPYNPIENPETNMNRKMSDTQDAYLWKKVSIKLYNLYGKFLLTRNRIYLSQLEAELQDG